MPRELGKLCHRYSSCSAVDTRLNLLSRYTNEWCNLPSEVWSRTPSSNAFQAGTEQESHSAKQRTWKLLGKGRKHIHHRLQHSVVKKRDKKKQVQLHAALLHTHFMFRFDLPIQARSCTPVMAQGIASVLKNIGSSFVLITM